MLKVFLSLSAFSASDLREVVVLFINATSTFTPATLNSNNEKY